MSGPTLRIHGLLMPPTQILKFALQRLHGISEYQSNRLCSLAGVNPMARIGEIVHSYAIIQRVVETCIPSKSQAHRDLAAVMQVLIKKGHYKAQRHQYALSVRGKKCYNGNTQRKLAVTRAKQFSYPLAPSRRNKN